MMPGEIGWPPTTVGALTLRLSARRRPRRSRQACRATATSFKSHIGHIFDKLDLRDRAAAVIFAFDNGLIQPAPPR
jgi:hypothetical protein